MNIVTHAHHILDTHLITCICRHPLNQNINYCVISSAVHQVGEGQTVFGVGQAVLNGPIPTAFGCNSHHGAQSMKSDL